MSLGRLRAAFGINTRKIVEGLTCAQGMCNSLGADTTTYANPTMSITTFQGVITSTSTAQQVVKTRLIGAVEKRNVQYGLLLTAMEIERAFVQSIADANPSHAASIITNAGLVVAAFSVHTKALLTLSLGKQSGSIACDANVGLLVGVGTSKPTQARFFGWQYTLDGSKTFITAPSTTHCKTLIQGLTPLTTVGVRVNLTNSEGPGPWSQVVTILVQ